MVDVKPQVLIAEYIAGLAGGHKGWFKANFLEAFDNPNLWFRNRGSQDGKNDAVTVESYRHNDGKSCVTITTWTLSEPHHTTIRGMLFNIGTQKFDSLEELERSGREYLEHNVADWSTW